MFRPRGRDRSNLRRGPNGDLPIEEAPSPGNRAARRLLRDALFGLRAVGLGREARRLAIEAALVRQL